MKRYSKYMMLIVFVFCINVVFGQIASIQTVNTTPIAKVTSVQNQTPTMTKSDLIESVSTEKSNSEDISEVEDIKADEPEDTQEHDPGITILEAISVTTDYDQQLGFGDGEKGKRPTTESDTPMVAGATEETGDNTRKTVRDQDIPTLSKEIVVIGSELRESTDKDEWSDILSITSETDDELEEYVEATVALDEAIEEVTVTDEVVMMKYKHPARFFGFDVDYTVSVTVNEQGVNVKYPWWVAFTENNAKELKTECEESSTLDDSQLANIDLQNTLQRRQKIIQTLSHIMKKHHDTAMAVIRKIG